MVLKNRILIQSLLLFLFYAPLALTQTISISPEIDSSLACYRPTFPPIIQATPLTHPLTASLAPLSFKSGWYVGLNAGYAVGTSSVNATMYNNSNHYIGPNWVSQVNKMEQGNINLNALTGGLSAGYNRLTGHYLSGIEIDFGFLNFNNSRYVSSFFNPALHDANFFTITNTVQTDWLGTLRYRFGYVIERLLIYATTGPAFIQLSSNTLYTDPNSINGPLYLNNNVKTIRAGVAVGGGVEWLLTEKWSVKIEDLFINFSELSNENQVLLINPNTNERYSNPFNFSSTLQVNIVRGGVVYHF